MRVLSQILVSLTLLAQLYTCGQSDFDNAGQTPPVLSSEELQASFLDKSKAYPDETGLLDMNPELAWIERIELSSALASMAGQLQSQPVIAVLDSGVDYRHPAFENRIVDTSGFRTRCENDRYGCDTSHYRYPQETLGHGHILPPGTEGEASECSSNGEAGFGKCAHGTHVAGIIAGFQPEQQIFGTCPTCLILPIKITNNAGNITDDAIYAALEYIAELKQQGLPIRVINSSFGKYQSSDRVMRALAQLGEFHADVLIVAASGNENSAQATFPAALPNVISVANVNSSNLVKDGRSNFGSTVDISAPVGQCNDLSNGFGIISTVPGGGSRCLNGTSMAAPLVSGVAGLLLSMHPNLRAADVKARILSTADSAALYAANPEYIYERQGEAHPLLGSGVLNAANAVKGQTASALPSKPAKRVAPGCGVLGASQDQAFGYIWFLCPLFFVLRRRRTRTMQTRGGQL